jgi:hypothetical protein
MRYTKPRGQIAVMNARPGECIGAQTTHNNMMNHITPHWNKNDFTQDRENSYPRTKTNYKERNLHLHPKIGRDKNYILLQEDNSALREENSILISKKTNTTPWEEGNIVLHPSSTK